MSEQKECQCPLCRRYHRFERILKKYKFTKGDKLFLEGLHCALDHEENDAQYYKLILDGKWPQSVDILERALKRAIKIKEKEDG